MIMQKLEEYTLQKKYLSLCVKATKEKQVSNPRI